MWRKWLCKQKGHEFQASYIEPDGWGNEWHWKKCKRCGYATFDTKPAGNEVKADG